MNPTKLGYSDKFKEAISAIRGINNGNSAPTIDKTNPFTTEFAPVTAAQNIGSGLIYNKFATSFVTTDDKDKNIEWSRKLLSSDANLNEFCQTYIEEYEVLINNECESVSPHMTQLFNAMKEIMEAS